MIVRENGSGTKDIIDVFLLKNNINKLNKVVTLNSTEAIKNYLYHSDHFALLSIHAVNKDLLNNQLKIIDIKNLTIERWFYFVKRTGFQSKMLQDFETFIITNYNF
jgi:DNA-binding transcriptional LysR family regulator